MKIDVDEVLQWPLPKILGYLNYLEIEPAWEMYSTGLICSVLANCHSKKHYKPSDFVPQLKQEQKTDVDDINSWKALFKR